MYTLPYGVKLPCLGYEFAKIQTDNYDCYSCHGYFDYQWRQVQYWTFLDPAAIYALYLSLTHIFHAVCVFCGLNVFA